MNEEKDHRAGQDRAKRDRRRGRQRGGGQPPGDQERNEPLDQFKKLIKENGFTDNQVMKLTDRLGEQLGAYNQENTTTQVRKFYNLVRVTKEQSRDKDENLVRVKLRTIQAQIAYAAARGTVSRNFKMFVDESFKRIVDDESKSVKQELKEFATFFEALFAYFYYHIEENKKRQGGRRR